MNPYQSLVSDYQHLLAQGKATPMGGIEPPPHPVLAADAPKALIFSPHPDDECIIAGLPLRLLRQTGTRVINVAVTQGSRKDRQTERFQELRNACTFMGYGLIQTHPNGLEGINPKGRDQDPARWAESVRVIADILRTEAPQVLFFPHDRDWNSTHIGTHDLVVEALKAVGTLECHTVETEYWGQMTDPNLMVESSATDVADMVAGTSFHVGEVQRNPFHLFLPAWMQDNVRRGSELVGGQGEAAPDFSFATLYRLRRWSNGRFEPVLDKGRQIACSENPKTLFPPTAA